MKRLIAVCLCAGILSACANPALTVLYRFKGGQDGGYPSSSLIMDKSGALYGTTSGYGASKHGTVFKLTPPATTGGEWIETMLYSFTGGNDGANPLAALIADKSGALFGTTYWGGGTDGNCSRSYGCGTVFELIPPTQGQAAWSEKVIYRFQGGEDGAHPTAGLVADAEGVLYGTTRDGGGGRCTPYTGNVRETGCGTIFELTPPAKGNAAWTETVLYRFKGSGDGAYPNGPLIIDQGGALYGTTSAGGVPWYCDCGTVFKLTPPEQGNAVWTKTLLYQFDGQSAGLFPHASLIMDESGALYGTTMTNETIRGGSVFKLTPPEKGQTAWTKTDLYLFKSSLVDSGDPIRPFAAIIADHSGALYGTGALMRTAQVKAGTKPALNNGAMFKLTPPRWGQPAWTETVLFSFAREGNNYVNTFSALIADKSGALYGTAQTGGILGACIYGDGCGTVFKLTGTGFTP